MNKLRPMHDLRGDVAEISWTENFTAVSCPNFNMPTRAHEDVVSQIVIVEAWSVPWVTSYPKTDIRPGVSFALASRRMVIFPPGIIMVSPSYAGMMYAELPTINLA
jgi:hypothetical protein